MSEISISRNRQAGPLRPSKLNLAGWALGVSVTSNEIIIIIIM